MVQTHFGSSVALETNNLFGLLTFGTDLVYIKKYIFILFNGNFKLKIF